MNKKYKIGIVGAGPAGSFSALLLSKLGHEVVMFEKREQINRKLCGEYLCPKGIELLQSYQLLDNLCHDFLPLKGMILNSPEEIVVQCSFPKTDKEWFGLALNRKTFDSRIIELACENGVIFKLGTSINAYEKMSNGWKLFSDDESFEFDLLIAADGRVSNIAKLLGHNSKLDTSRIAAHFYLPRKNMHGLRYGEMHIFKDGAYCGLDPINDEEVNVSFVFDSYRVKDQNLFEICNQYLNNSKRLALMFGEIPRNAEIKVVTPLTNKNSFIAGNNLAYVGDASGFIDPLTGEGIYNALLSAHLLSTSIDKNADITTALHQYKRNKLRVQFQKKVLNTIFQRVIKSPFFCMLIAKFIEKKTKRADYFIGIIGNVYSPIKGVLKLLNPLI